MNRNARPGISVVWVAIACLMITVSISAQSGRRGGNQGANQGPGRNGAPGFPGIDLSDEQKATLSTIRQNEQQQVDAIRNDSTLSPEEKRAQIETIRRSSREQSQAVLTPEQRQTIADRRGNMGRPGERGIGGDLGLSDEQKAQMETIRKSEQEQIQAVRNDSTLSREEKQARIESIRQSSREQSQGVLTPEQQQKIADRRANAPNGGQRPGGRNGGFGNGQRRPGGGRRGGRP